MSSFLEFEGKNIDQAVSSACEALNLETTQLRYKVLSHGSTGIFGLVGIKKAKIRVEVAETEAAADDGKEKKTATAPSEPEKDGVEEEIAPVATEKNLEPASENGKSNVSEEKSGSEDSRNIGEDALRKIVGQISSEAEIHFRGNKEALSFEILGGRSALLIGKNGQTLEAIQYIVEKIINKRTERRVRLEIDIEGYRANKKENLISLAKKLAEKTKRTGKPSTIGQMNAQDRRTIHLALKDEKSVRTQSLGDGYIRKLVIFPKKGAGRKKGVPVRENNQK